MKTDKSQNLYIITGGPGVGKTSLIQALNDEGYQTVPEEARRIIQEQNQINGDAVPWKNPQQYTELMLEASIDSYQKVSKETTDKIVFFDRGLFDTFCYMQMCDIKISKGLLAKTQNISYNKHVFILPPWKEIFVTDSERKQSWEEAHKTYLEMRKTYFSLGYDLIEVPKDTIANRVKYVLRHIASHSKRQSHIF